MNALPPNQAPTPRGGAPVRRMWPYAVFVPPAAGALIYAGNKAGLYGADVRVPLLVVVGVGLAVWLLVHAAGIADRVEAERLETERRNEAAAPALAQRAAELEHANAELAEAKAQLEHSNEELQRFATVASHDLREPLRVVSGFADLLARRYGDRLEGDAHEFLDAITGGVRRMDEMISDLLAYARAGRVDQPFEAVDMDAAVGDALSALQLAIDDAGATVEVTPLPVVQGNPAALRQLFQNLIANAVKFAADEPPRVRIWAAEVPGGWRFTVRDNGIGVDPEQADRIFGMFQRLHSVESYPGTGVGLALCQRIVHVHGGHIWVEPAPGGGSQFMFTIASSA